MKKEAEEEEEKGEEEERSLTLGASFTNAHGNHNQPCTPCLFKLHVERVLHITRIKQFTHGFFLIPFMYQSLNKQTLFLLMLRLGNKWLL